MSPAKKVLLLLSALLLVCSGAWKTADAACPLDGASHPAVTYIFGQTTDPATCNVELVSTCQAILVSPTVAVTSAACAEDWSTGSGGLFTITAAWLSHDPNNLANACTGADRIASWHIHPDWDGTRTSPFNIAVIVLEATSGEAPATLPSAGDVSALLRGDALEVAAFSAEGNVLTTVRRDQPARFARATDAYFKVKTSGKACPAPDGSGVFLPSSQDVLGMSIGSRQGFLRLDTTTVRELLAGYVTLP